jgi:cytochrome c551/c552
VKKIIPLRSDLLTLITATLAVIFVLVAQAPGQTAKKDKCQVCHNTKNPHTIEISCKNVAQYLANHPGDYAGPCQGVTNEKPKKKP